MKPILYYYEHCPYCIRVLTVLNMAGVEFEKKVLLNDDEQTPINMIGQKMLPILAVGPDDYLAESLDIIDYISETYDVRLQSNPVWEAKVTDLLQRNRKANYGLSMPRWVKAPLKEFATDAAKNYFIQKKTATIGDFSLALENTPELMGSLVTGLEKEAALFDLLSAHPASKAAIMLFSGLYGIRYVEGFSWPSSAERFMRLMTASAQLPFLE